MRKPSLRLRVAVSSALLGIVVSACLALIARQFADVYVDRLTLQVLHAEAVTLIERIRQDPNTPMPKFKQFTAYFPAADGSGVPPDIARLGVGDHDEDEWSESERQVSVYQIDDRRLYVALDLTSAVRRTRRFVKELSIMVLLGSALSGWLGWALAGRAIRPVRRLAARVEELQPPYDSAALAPEFASDEVGILARAFDSYQERLQEFLRRERDFTADASHELRTPIAVIRGAVEVMQENASLDSGDRERLMRVQRGADALSDLLDSMLALSRQGGAGDNAVEDVDLDREIDALLAARRSDLAARHVTATVSCPVPVAMRLPRRTFTIVFNNILRCATQFAEGGNIDVVCEPGVVRLTYRRGDLPAPRPGGLRRGPDSGGGGNTLGLLMLQRLCERCGWNLSERNDAVSGREFVLRFSLA
jgi:signal transduction histidine kinase